MPTVRVGLEYLQKLPLYEQEKPYWCFLPPRDGFDPNTQRVDNLEFEAHSDIQIRDIRDLKTPPSIDDCGFEVVAHHSEFTGLETREDVNRYCAEADQLLKAKLNAVFVKSYDSIQRKNVPFQRDCMDLADPLRKEGPARGVHNDITYDSGPMTINRYLTEEEKAKFLRPGYRFRIINTWRPQIPLLEDRPLALCDSRSVDPDDLVAADRVAPGKNGEVYYLTHNSNHQWYWLNKQTPSEPFIFTMYDTKDGPHARFCPHVSFVNPTAPTDAAPRESIETRHIVITR